LSHNPHHDLSDEALDALLASFRVTFRHPAGPPVAPSYDRRATQADGTVEHYPVEKGVDSPG
jgi:hypothetical protein